MTASVLAMVWLLVASAQHGAAVDECTELVPESLQNEITREFPGFRSVRAVDYSAEDIARERQYHHGSSCLGVASADVDGDGRQDYGLLITSEKGHTLVVAARARAQGGWRLEKLSDFGDAGPARSYVNVIEPGSYQDLGLSDEKEAGQVTRFRSRRPGFIAGTMESSGVAFFFTGKRWVHLWLSD